MIRCQMLRRTRCNLPAKLIDLLAAKRRQYNLYLLKYLAEPYCELWILFDWIAQLATTFSLIWKMFLLSPCWLFAGVAQGHFSLPIDLLMMVHLFLLLELFSKFTRRALSDLERHSNHFIHFLVKSFLFCETLIAFQFCFQNHVIGQGEESKVNT